MSTPDEVLRSIRDTRADLLRGAEFLHDTELAAERAEEAAQLAFDKAFMTADGSIPEKQAIARAASTEARDAGFVARAAHNRVRAKIRGLESALVSLQSELKFLQQEGA